MVHAVFHLRIFYFTYRHTPIFSRSSFQILSAAEWCSLFSMEYLFFCQNKKKIFRTKLFERSSGETPVIWILIHILICWWGRIIFRNDQRFAERQFELFRSKYLFFFIRLKPIVRTVRFWLKIIPNVLGTLLLSTKYDAN